MKKHFFLIGLIGVAIIAATIASNARVLHVIYVTDFTRPDQCKLAVTGKTMLASPNGILKATTSFGLPCVLALTSDVDN